ncbi:MAG TPA: carboxylesterase family protein [Bryobacteraceae bacterium]|nr:carboxylesterase family protein [Bryobacteraceae bacterium]
MEITRRTALHTFSAALGTLAAARAQSSETVTAKTVYGQVRGARKDHFVVFKGIPYAGSPEGAGRFKPAPKLKAWAGVRDALLYGAQSVQPPDPNWPKEWKPASSGEDCLFLNVWTPAVDHSNRPVMFYSHGGGFATGNGGADVAPQDAMHDGGPLARDYDVVVVTHNHRLGIMGYLYLGDLLGEEYAASGVAGMLDIAAALQWVHDNIAEFGGDPERVMIWGESGGGAKTTTLTAMPRAQGLYQLASIESGSMLRLKTRESASDTTRAVLKSLDLTEKDVRQLLTVPTGKLIAAGQSLPRPRATGGFPSVTSGMADGLGFAPMVDGHEIPANPYDPVAPKISAQVPMIVGTNKFETQFIFRGNPAILKMDDAALRQRLDAMFADKAAHVFDVYRRSRPDASPGELFLAITTAQWMGMDAIRMAERKVALHAAPVFMYVFAHGAAGHASEMQYKFDHVPGKTARNMSRAWASFARNGDPSHDQIPRWPAYTLGERATMFIDDECRVVNDPYREERLLWEG